MKSENDSNLDREPDLTPSARPVNPAVAPVAGIVQCPHCGSTCVRRRTRPLVFNAIACVVTLVLTPVVCAMALGILISFLALPITTCIAVVGRNRCRDCRNRFEPADYDARASLLPCFPWRFHFGNIAVLFLLCVVGPSFLRMKAGAERLPDDMRTMGLLTTFGFLVWCFLVWHVILYKTVRRRTANPRIWAALFLLPGVLGGAFVFHVTSPKILTGGLLAYAQLAPLPKSATAVKSYSWSSPFSGEDFLRFTAEPNDIERFLANSPALRGQQPERYSARRMRLKYPTDAQGNTIYQMDANEYIVPHGSTPSWYKQEIRGPARKYIVQPPEYQFPGQVLVDDETNTVYIYLLFS